MPDTELINRAASFSRAAHQAIGHRRKYTGEPYYQHPARVARLVQLYNPDARVVAAAYLHDVVEDTQVSFLDIEQEFGARVAVMVYELTDQFTDPGLGNRAQRKQLERERLATISAEAQTIKYADLLDNTSSIVGHDPNFAKVYLVEKRNILESMTAGDMTLWNRAMNAQEAGTASLNKGQNPYKFVMAYKYPD